MANTQGTRSGLLRQMPEIDIKKLAGDQAQHLDDYVDFKSRTDETQLVLPHSDGKEVEEIPFSLLSEVTKGFAPDERFAAVSHLLGYRSRFHRHDYTELTYVIEGSVLLITSEQVYVVNAGECIFIPKGLPHAISPIVRGGRCPLEIDMLFTDALFDEMNRLHLEERVVDINGRAHCMFISKSIGSQFTSCLELLMMAYAQSGYRMDLAVYGLLFAAMHICMALEADIESVSPLQKRLVSVINDNLSDVSLETVAQRLGYSVGYMSRLVKKTTGKTVGEFIVEARLDATQYYLSRTSMPVEQIAQRVGYNSVSHLYKMFAKRYHQTPKQYRAIFRIE